jgi:ribonuclease Z
MFELLFLGTGASVPTVDRGLAALIVAAGRHRFLVDCGEGTQRQLLRSGTGFRRLNHVLLTHGHLDHVLGLAGLASTMALLQANEHLIIHAGARTLALARRLLLEIAWPDGRPRLALDFRPLEPGPILVEDDLTVSAFPVQHGETDSFGFAFETPSRRRLIVEQLAEHRVPSGPVRAQLACGIPADLPDGRRIDPETVLGPSEAGTKLVVVGDTGDTGSLVTPAMGADALVIEATFLTADAELARQRSHLTSAQAAALAAKAGVGTLVLTHLSGRYTPDQVAEEARSIFPRVHVAADFDRLTIARRRPGLAPDGSPTAPIEQVTIC